MFFRHIQQSFSLRKNLAHLVEQLSVKQCVVGSIPSILSFVPSICLDSLLAVRSTGLKNRRVVVRLHLQAPQCEKPLL